MYSFTRKEIQKFTWNTCLAEMKRRVSSFEEQYAMVDNFGPELSPAVWLSKQLSRNMLTQFIYSISRVLLYF